MLNQRALALLLPAFCAAAAAAADLDTDYLRRDTPGKLEANIAALQAALDTPPDGTPKAGVLWRLCRAEVRRGERREAKADRLADFVLARGHCEASVALSSAAADAHFWLGVAMGRWGETKGVLKAVLLVKPIRREMALTLGLDPRHGGAHRTLAEILWQLPGLMGGDKKAALAEFEAAVRLSPGYTANYVPLAKAYLHFGRRVEAARTLQAVAAVKEPSDPAAFPDDLAEARALLASSTPP